jgi:F-type H+-transporting ATPase subunit epsilon
MPEHTFKLEVITPDRVVTSDDEIVSVVAPGSEGYFGVLAHHAPMMAELAIGKLDFRRDDGTSGAMAVSGGFLEVFEDKVSVLAESAELVEQIDVERAEQAKKRAEERLAAAGSDVDAARAEAALQRALNRLHVARKI